jgi:magnesium transporter
MLKRSTLHLRRVIGPQRSAQQACRDDYQVIDAKARLLPGCLRSPGAPARHFGEHPRPGERRTGHLLGDQQPHERYHENLTVITTMFMPISFIASFFGMNFFSPVAPLDIWTVEAAFIITMAIIILTPVAFFLWIRRRGWM